MLHVWYIYLNVGYFYSKCWYIFQHHGAYGYVMADFQLRMFDFCLLFAHPVYFGYTATLPFAITSCYILIATNEKQKVQLCQNTLDASATYLICWEITSRIKSQFSWNGYHLFYPLDHRPRFNNNWTHWNLYPKNKHRTPMKIKKNLRT